MEVNLRLLSLDALVEKSFDFYCDSLGKFPFACFGFWVEKEVLGPLLGPSLDPRVNQFPVLVRVFVIRQVFFVDLVPLDLVFLVNVVGSVVGLFFDVYPL